MSDIMFDTSGSSETCKDTLENNKHKLFVKKRRFLERMGCLNKKQNEQNHRQRNTHHRPPPPCHDGASRSSQPGAVRISSACSQNSHSKSSYHKPSSEHATCSDPQLASSAGSSSSLTITVNPGQNTATSTQGEQARPIRTVAVSSPIPGSLDLCNPLKYLAMDCEMVGTGPKGHIGELARCSIVSYNGDVVYDRYIKPTNPVTDYRTRWSGISWHQLVMAVPFLHAKKEILKILAGKVVIGHAIQNDFKSLGYSHPAVLTRDTSRIPLLNRKAGFPEKEVASLKRLTKALFNRNIQTGKNGHSSVEDAKATMELYKVVEVDWERTLASKLQSQREFSETE
ncbi:hypothetical protein DPEC_G00353370 [Dallia pectoralis]|uniref:Uncharacterized protein n=1 Tax=Dallia pectoralis TaxID=75939 RepID=A0ACC2F2I3_DALPE|nr:hypothetical protein DPEC_G00353370 [Dallia pectoralis]